MGFLDFDPSTARFLGLGYDDDDDDDQFIPDVDHIFCSESSMSDELDVDTRDEDCMH